MAGFSLTAGMPWVTAWLPYPTLEHCTAVHRLPALAESQKLVFDLCWASTSCGVVGPVLALLPCR